MKREVEHVEFDGQLLAIIVRQTFRTPGIHFFTSPDLSQQLAYMHHPAGKRIEAHIHNPVSREVSLTQEVLLIRRGRLRVDFYDAGKRYLESQILGAGDVILLVSGGHGFEALEEVEMLEVKQGPYVGDNDKTVFPSVELEQTIVRKNTDG
jgi:mannose-6-phosphate isomerase-like protein (cupin superfamily)